MCDTQRWKVLLICELLSVSITIENNFNSSLSFCKNNQKVCCSYIVIYVCSIRPIYTDEKTQQNKLGKRACTDWRQGRQMKFQCEYLIRIHIEESSKHNNHHQIPINSNQHNKLHQIPINSNQHNKLHQIAINSNQHNKLHQIIDSIDCVIDSR